MTELTYTEIDGLLYPDIKINDEELLNDLGKYGELRLRYLYTHTPEMYRELLFTGKLAQHCTDIDKTAFDRSECIYADYIKKNFLSEDGFWQRVQICTQATNIADEVVKSELIYI